MAEGMSNLWNFLKLTDDDEEIICEKEGLEVTENLEGKH